jgi:hypothetical protein
MTISADERDELREMARASWGDRGAHLLMVGLGDAASGIEERLTERIDGVRSDLTADFAALRSEFVDLKSEFADLRMEFGDLRGEFGDLRGEFGDLRGEFGELRGDFGRLEGVVGKELGGIRTELANQTRVLYFALVATVLAIAALAFNAYQLGAA